MYETLSGDYDRFVDWEGRLAAEVPFIEHQLRAVQAQRVLDVACGTGMHAIALAKLGYEVVGVDVSQGMIEKAQANAARDDVDVRFEVAGFGTLTKTLTASDPFDAVLCLGNSLPHVLTRAELLVTLTDFAASLRLGGLLLIQDRNFDAVLTLQQRWMDPQAHREDDTEWLFLRFYDFRPDETLTFNMVTLQRQSSGRWEQRVSSTRLWPLTRDDLIAALEATCYDSLSCFGDMQGSPFDAEGSPNLVVAARRTPG